MSTQHREPLRAADGRRRPTAPTPLFTSASITSASITAESFTSDAPPAWEITETPPLAWVPFVYTEAQERTFRVRRRLSVSSIVLGVVGLLGALIGVFGLPLSTGAVICAVAARFTERRAGALWIIGLATGLVGLLIGIGWLVLISRVIVPLL